MLLAAALLAAAAPLPTPVRRYLARAAQCDHWAGEEPYDRRRAAEIGAAIRRLRCDTLAREAGRLRRRYRGDVAVQHALAATGAALHRKHRLGYPRRSIQQT